MNAKLLFAAAIMCAAIALCPGYENMADAQEPKGFELLPGIVVDSGRQLVYVMNKDKGIDAIDVDGGKLVWTSRAAAKPLGVKDNLLITQAETESGAMLQVVALNAQDGDTVVTGQMDLPESVQVSIDETLRGSFVARAATRGSDAVVVWQFSERPIRAIATPEDAGGLPGDNDVTRSAANGPRFESGAYKLDLSTGEMSGVHVEDGFDVGTQARSLTAENRIPGIPAETQYLSADGKHVMASERTDDDRAWDKYRLTIFDRRTGEPVGEFKSHLSWVPFFVSENRAIFETGPYVIRRDGELVAEPRKIHAVDLVAGNEVWSHEVRDTAFRGPFPP